mmetsp:Transcript_18089/g.45357  ORF Transcript_18089/g.45357 Transcript_18089/m.45357 type:complete len:630 (-) Transcript_18089:150-2039(-)
MTAADNTGVGGARAQTAVPPDRTDDVGPLDSISNVGSSTSATTAWQGIDFSSRPPKPVLPENAQYTYNPDYYLEYQEVAPDGKSMNTWLRNMSSTPATASSSTAPAASAGTAFATKVQVEGEQAGPSRLLRRGSTLSFANALQLFGRRDSSDQLVLPGSAAASDRWGEAAKPVTPFSAPKAVVANPPASSSTTATGNNGASEEHPHPPTVVQVVFDFNMWAVENNDSRETLRAKFTVNWYWVDERLIGYPTDKDLPKNIWRPELMACQGVSCDEKYETLPKFQAGPHQRSRGELTLVTVCTVDPGVDLSKDLERLRVFPFDSLRLDWSIQPNNMKRFDGNDELQLRVDRVNTGAKREAGHPQQHLNWYPGNRQSGEYECVEFRYALGAIVWKEKRIRQFLFSLHVRRTSTYYVLKGMVPLYFSMLFGAMNYFLEVNDLSTRLQTILGLFLTCFAIQWTLLERLPKFPFLTVLDNVAYSVVVALFLMGAGFCLAYTVARRKIVVDPLGQTTQAGEATGREFSVSFDLDRGEAVDRVCGTLLAGYWLVWCIGYKFVWVVFFSKKTRCGGAFRRWRDGTELRNKMFKPCRAWRIALSPEFFAGGVFLGQGTEIPWDGKEKMWNDREPLVTDF